MSQTAKKTSLCVGAENSVYLGHYFVMGLMIAMMGQMKIFVVIAISQIMNEVHRFP